MCSSDSSDNSLSKLECLESDDDVDLQHIGQVTLENSVYHYRSQVSSSLVIQLKHQPEKAS